MRNILAVAGKELRAYFHSPIAYLVMATYALVCGYFWWLYVGQFVLMSFRMMMSGGGGPTMNLNETVIRFLLEGAILVVLLLLIPLITMRLYAEEKRSGTMELLLTSPLTDLDIILGKFLGALALYTVLVLITFFYIGILFLYGNPAAKPLIANALGLFLFGGALLALGMWFSTFTRNQIIAAVIAFVVFLLLYIMDAVTEFSSGTLGNFLGNLGLRAHYENFAKGVIDLPDVVFYLSIIMIGLFLTARSMEALKGRP
jgi:ABC-2 type transport system permease protein